METSSSLESTDPTEKKIGKLRKKLQQIEALKQRQADGEKLEVNQVDMHLCTSLNKYASTINHKMYFVVIL